MEELTDKLPLLLISLLVFSIICIVITRLIFSIPSILRYYKVQTLLLIKIARAKGVSDKEIDDVLDLFNRKEKSEVFPEFTIRKLDEITRDKQS